MVPRLRLKCSSMSPLVSGSEEGCSERVVSGTSEQ